MKLKTNKKLESVETYTQLGKAYSHMDFARCTNLFFKNPNNGFVSKR